ncbi:hypothetical protein FVEG_16273 [Fusarium verticillioides 7600]|uniref:Uncharacterized protein n=1 Tax=Gibberella moniliformis (strain M3125 / FGSC 7600) TaxID=334819 RepID=W7MLR0_GIBM7|nr:hypothetical protein FVEG_16273 [Fusarium verticillioides 7600]EWG48455.1 hypothetical protein FVEG_16273 [Fusarium verticillioides 7600]
MSNKDDEGMRATRNIGQLAKTRWTLFQLEPEVSPSWAVAHKLEAIGRLQIYVS